MVYVWVFFPSADVTSTEIVVTASGVQEYCLVVPDAQGARA